jgi:tetratricopeptide (TPR) repeat protein
MEIKPKDWLVRTRTGEILGPFTPHELMEELQKRAFSPDDEIAPSLGSWVSAQTLVNHDVDEVTHTSTRSQTYSRSTSVPLNSEVPVMELDEKAADDDTLTPTPDFSGRSPANISVPPANNVSGSASVPVTGHGPVSPGAHSANDDADSDNSTVQKFLPFLVALVVIFGLGALILQIRPAKTPNLRDNHNSPSANVTSESPFVKKIYSMIYAGENQPALKLLAEHHEKHSRSDGSDIEYMVPYAALLILENEAPGRARKLLEDVLASNTTAQIKSHAHHWLGYLLLSQDDGDMGESHFLEELQLVPKDAAARFNLGRVYLKQEKYSQALDYLNLAELEAPDLWLVHIYKGTAKFKLDNMAEARIAFKTAVQSSPDRWLSYIYYATFLMGIHETESAQETLRTMLTRDPGYELSAPAPFGFYQEKVEYSAYLTAYSQVMEKNSAPERELGKLYINYLLNGPAGIEGRKLEQIALRGDITTKVIALKVMLDREARPEELRAALAAFPPNISDFGYYAYVLRAQAKIRLGLSAEAQQDLQKALNLDPKAAIAHFTMAAVFKKAQKFEDEQMEINTLLGYHPNYIPAIVLSRNF